MYEVKLYSASGREVYVTVGGCRTEEQACKAALLAHEEIDPGQGWQAVYALER